MSSILELLLKEGFITFEEDSNLVSADRAFFAYRAIEWIRRKAPEPGFNLQAYLVALTYYKLGLAEMRLEEDDLLYRYVGPSVGALIDELPEDDSKPLGGFHRPGEDPPTQEKEEETRGTDNSPEPS
jgi:hypothetical protein